MDQSSTAVTGSIRKKLTVTTLSLAIIPLLIIGLLLSYQNYKNQARQALALELEVAKRLAVEIKAHIKSLERDIHTTISMGNLQYKNLEEQTTLLVNLQIVQRAFDELILMDETGRETVRLSRTDIFSTDELTNRYDDPMFTYPRKTRNIYYSSIKINENVGVPMMTMAIPFSNLRKGSLSGVLAAEIRLKEIWDFISKIELSSGELLYIVDSDNRIIAHANPTVVLRGTRFELPKKDGFNIGLNGNKVIMAVRHVTFGNQTLNIVAERNLTDALAYTISTTILNLIQTIVLSLVILITLVFSIKKIILDNIRLLNTAVTNFSHKNFKVRVNINSNDELENLSTNFNEMAQMIEKYSEQMEEIVAEKTEELNEMNISLTEAHNKMLEDLNFARKIQESILPKVFPYTGKTIFFGYYKPMESLGGDFYDVFKISPTKIAVLIADVCGHGVGASLITTMAKISFRNNSSPNSSAADVVTRVNNELCNALGEIVSYLTAFYCIIDLNTGKGEYTNAGHPEIFIINKIGAIEALQRNSFYIGMMQNVTFKNTPFILNEDDRMVLYTDGIVEIMDKNMRIYDIERFKQFIVANKDNDIEMMIMNLVEELNGFVKGKKPDDDMTILVLDMKTEPDIVDFDYRYLEELNVFRESDEEVIAEKYTPPLDLFASAIALSKEGRFNESIKLLEDNKEEFRRTEDDFKVSLLTGYNYYKQNKPDIALQLFQHAGKLFPEYKKLTHYIDVVNYRLTGKITRDSSYSDK